jgi:hypothetical protein
MSSRIKGPPFLRTRHQGLPDWRPTPNHFPILEKDGGRLTVDNVRLAHRLCSRVDYAKNHWGRYPTRSRKARVRSITSVVDASSYSSHERSVNRWPEPG